MIPTDIKNKSQIQDRFCACALGRAAYTVGMGWAALRCEIDIMIGDLATDNRISTGPADTAFLALPIDLPETEYLPNGWRRQVVRKATVADLLKIWDIDDPTETCEMAQVLRHLRQIMRDCL